MFFVAVFYYFRCSSDLFFQYKVTTMIVFLYLLGRHFNSNFLLMVGLVIWS